MAKAKKSPSKSEGRVMMVASLSDSFRRAGILFTRQPTEVREAEIGKDRFEMIRAERMLRCEMK